MRTFPKFAVRLLVVFALLAAVQLSLTPLRTGSTPYASALSDLASGSVYAAGGCAFRTCLFRGERLYCKSTTLFEKCAQSGTNCTSTSC